MAVTFQYLGIIKTNPETITVKFSGLPTNSARDQYSIILRFDDGIYHKEGDSNDIAEDFTGAGASQVTFNGIRNLTPGRAIYAVIVNLSNENEVYSDRVAIVNKLPTCSIGQTSITITTGGSVTFTVNGSDPDGSVVKMNYELGGKSGEVSGSNISATFKADDYDSGVYAVVFTVTDNLGDISTSTGYFEVVHKANITSFTVEGITARNHNNTKDLTHSIKFSYKFRRSAKIKKCEIVAKYNSKSVSIYLKDFSNSNISEGSDSINIYRSGLIPDGTYFTLELKITSSDGSIATKSNSTTIRKPQVITAKVQVTKETNDGPEGNSYGVYKEKITLTISKPVLNDNNFPIKTISIKGKESGRTWSLPASNFQNGSATIQVTGEDSYEFQIMDMQGRTSGYQTEYTISLRKLSILQDAKINFITTPKSDSIVEYYEAKASTLELSHINISNGYLNGVDVKYNYIFKLNNMSFTLKTNDNGSDVNAYSLKSIESLSDLVERIFSSSKPNLTQYSTEVIINARDDFGQTASWTSKFNINFNCKPRLVNNIFNYYHSFDQNFEFGSNVTDFEKNGHCYSIVSGDDSRIFHRNEFLIIKFPLIYLDDEINKITQLKITTTANNKTTTKTITDGKYFKVVEDTENNIKGYRCYYARQIPSYSSYIEELYNFSIINEGGKELKIVVNDAPCECYPLVNFIPNFEVTQRVTFIDNKLTNIEATYKDINFGDLINDTNSHFKRKVTVRANGAMAGTNESPIYYGGGINAKIYIDQDQTFKDYKYNIVATSLQESSGDDRFVVGGNPTNILNFEFNESNAITWDKFFVKFQLEFEVGLNDSINSIEVIKYYYGNAPTVAHRYHHIGINTSQFSETEKEILVIRDYDNFKYVRLVGKDSAGNDKNILINVQDGTIDGLTIDCGIW